MTIDGKTIEAFVNDQVKKWKKSRQGHLPVITVSTEPGSGGHIIAQQVAKQLGVALYDRDIVKGIAESARISDSVIASMEKERLSGIEDFISSLLDKHYIYPGVYLEHLMKRPPSSATPSTSSSVPRRKMGFSPINCRCCL
jgi:cytidylate kinase